MSQPSRMFDRAEVSAAAMPRLRDAERQLSALLAENEIIELSCRPSLWFIPITSARFALAMAALSAAAIWLQWNGVGGPFGTAVSLFALAALARVGLATLQWASRLYILTNRRVFAYKGVLSVQVSQCPLVRIERADLLVTTVQRALGLGTVRITPAADLCGDVHWEHLSEPTQTYQKLIRAIRRAQSE